MRNKTLRAAAVLAIATGSGVHAEECSDNLIVASLQTNSNLTNDVRLSVLVTEKIYNDAGRGGSGKGSLYGVPVGASYGDYKKHSEERLRSLNFSNFHNEAQNLLWSGVETNALAAYNSCLNADRFGLFAEIKKSNSSEVAFTLTYRPTAGGDDLKLTWTGNTNGMRLPITIPAHGVIAVVVPRPEAGGRIIAAYSGSMTTEFLEVSSWPGEPPAPMPYVGMTGADVKLGEDIGDPNKGSIEVGDGYAVKNVWYRPVDENQPHVHQFFFDVYSPDGRLVASQLQFINSNLAPEAEWRPRSASIDGRSLAYGFIHQNDGAATLFYKWQ